MKTGQPWRINMGDIPIFSGARHRPPLKRPLWIIVLVSLVSIFVICAFLYPPQSSAACYIFSSRGCKAIADWLPPAPAREYNDDEIASRVVIKEILSAPPVQSKNPKLAFMFLTPSAVPFEKLWDKFFHVRFDHYRVIYQTKCLLFFLPFILIFASMHLLRGCFKHIQSVSDCCLICFLI